MTDVLRARPDDLDSVVAAWRLSPDAHEFNEPARDAELAAAEMSIGRPLPANLRALYGFSNGMEALEGNLQVEPLLGEDAGLVGMSDRLRGWDWPIPDEVLMFGGNGADALFGLWYPADTAPNAPSPVVMVGSVFEPACLALAGTSLPAFLRAWSGYYLRLLDAPPAALDALGLADHLRELDQGTVLRSYFEWADPSLADPDPDPYEHGLDAAQLAVILSP